MSAPKPLSKPRFEALLYRREPFVDLIVREVEWWSNEDESLIATITVDIQDEDYAYVILGRDETGVFRGVAVMSSHPTIEEARENMTQLITELSKDGAQEFPQGDIEAKKHEILVPCVPEEKLHPNFRRLKESESYSPARGIIKELSYAFTDLDGNYRKDFQTTGFDGRLWELYLYAAFYEQRFIIHNNYAVPDFLVESPLGRFAIEAVTVNPTEGVAPPTPRSAAEEELLCRDYMPIKWGSPLISKLRKRYWEVDHVSDIPLVLAIHDFHALGSMVWSLPALSDCLFGLRKGEDGKDHPVDFYNFGDKKDIPAGIFLQPDAENVAAVIASNGATLPKFNRMGQIAGFGEPDIIIERVGVILDLETQKYEPFQTKVEVGKVSELWSDGLWVFHNPRAKHPLPLEAFPDALNILLDGDGQRNYRSTKRAHVERSITRFSSPDTKSF